MMFIVVDNLFLFLVFAIRTKRDGRQFDATDRWYQVALLAANNLAVKFSARRSGVNRTHRCVHMQLQVRCQLLQIDGHANKNVL